MSYKDVADLSQKLLGHATWLKDVVGKVCSNAKFTINDDINGKFLDVKAAVDEANTFVCATQAANLILNKPSDQTRAQSAAAVREFNKTCARRQSSPLPEVAEWLNQQLLKDT
eukprot:4568999-Alexandrium_andersonii.AAC.1